MVSPVTGATPPSPSLQSHTTSGSVTSFSMQPQDHRLQPLNEDRVKASLQECEVIRFAAYRTAAKVEILQNALKLDKIRFGVVCNVFHHHGLTSSESDVLLDPSEASDLISDIFFAASKVRSYYSPPMDVEALTEATLKTVTETFDPKGCIGGILVGALKVFLVVLCEGRLRDKFLYLFRQFESPTSAGHVRRKGLTQLLRFLAALAEFFGEAISFGGESLVHASVAQCFMLDATAHAQETLTEEAFSRWLLQEPQILVWLPTHFRMVMARGVRHGVRCSSCRMEDIIGLRYQCLRCLNFDLCQHCFFRGKKCASGRGHKLEHPMQEYCYRSSKKEATKAFMKLLVNKLRKRKLSHMRQRYLSPHSQNEAGAAARFDARKRRLQRRSSSSGDDDSSGFHSEGERGSAEFGSNSPPPDTVDSGATPEVATENDHAATILRQEGDRIVVRSEEDQVESTAADNKAEPNQGELKPHEKTFQSIVMHLEEANKEIMGKAAQGTVSDDCVQLQVQLNRLKTLMDQIFSSHIDTKAAGSSLSLHRLSRPLSLIGAISEPSLIESTPVMSKPSNVGASTKKTERRSLIPGGAAPFSPICTKPVGVHQPTPSTSLVLQTQTQQQQEPPSPDLGQPQVSFAPGGSEDTASSTLPSLSELSFGDLSSFLMKTGQPQPAEADLEKLNVTQGLEAANSSPPNNGEEPQEESEDLDTLEELETLMLRLDTVFKSFGDKNLLAANSTVNLRAREVNDLGDTAASTAGCRRHRGRGGRSRSDFHISVQTGS